MAFRAIPICWLPIKVVDRAGLSSLENGRPGGVCCRAQLRGFISETTQRASPRRNADVFGPGKAKYFRPSRHDGGMAWVEHFCRHDTVETLN